MDCTIERAAWINFLVCPYLYKSNFTTTSYQLILTDGKTGWEENLDQEAIARRMKRLNPNIEAPGEKIMDVIESLLDSKKVEDPDYQIELCDTESSSGRMVVRIKSKLSGLPFHWEFSAMKLSSEKFATHFTMPLLGMVGELIRREKELFTVLRLKDKEIQDYKSQGGSVSRKHLETTQFDPVVFSEAMFSSQVFDDDISRLGQLAFCDSGRSLYTKIMTRKAESKQETPPREALEGDSLRDEDSSVHASTQSVASSWNDRIPGSLCGETLMSSSNPAGDKQVDDKDAEESRRIALQKRLQEEIERKEEKAKRKKKKMKF